MAWRYIPLLGLLLSRAAVACVCAPNRPTIKESWQDAPLVFLGTVDTAIPDLDDGDTGMSKEQTVRIRIDEPFKGGIRGQTIELHQGANDCDWKFKTGQRAVFYSHREEGSGRWVVPWCSRSLGSAESGSDDLLFLRGLPDSAKGTRLSGTVEQVAYTVAGMRGVPGVAVQITAQDGSIRETTTNSAGAFEVYGLPPGAYSVDIEVPDGLRISEPLDSETAQLKLNSDGDAHAQFVLKADTYLSGRTLNAEGRPLSGLCVHLEPAGNEPLEQVRFCSNAAASFGKAMIAPGRYFLVARDTVIRDGLTSRSTLYYPGVRDRRKAMPIDLTAGNPVEGIDFQLAAAELRFRFSGVLNFNDGAPVGGATVMFQSPLAGYTESTTTDSHGHFGLTAAAGMDGLLSAQFIVMTKTLESCGELNVGPAKKGLMRFIDAAPVAISSSANHDDLQIRLPSPSCKALAPAIEPAKP